MFCSFLWWGGVSKVNELHPSSGQNDPTPVSEQSSLGGTMEKVYSFNSRTGKLCFTSLARKHWTVPNANIWLLFFFFFFLLIRWSKGLRGSRDFGSMHKVNSAVSNGIVRFHSSALIRISAKWSHSTECPLNWNQGRLCLLSQISAPKWEWYENAELITFYSWFHKSAPVRDTSS